MPKKLKKNKDLRKLVQAVLVIDFRFYVNLEAAIRRLHVAHRERARLENVSSDDEALRKAKQKEARLVNGLIARIRGSSTKNFKALGKAVGDLMKVVESNRWDYPFNSK